MIKQYTQSNHIFNLVGTRGLNLYSFICEKCKKHIWVYDSRRTVIGLTDLAVKILTQVNLYYFNNDKIIKCKFNQNKKLISHKIPKCLYTSEEAMVKDIIQ